MKKIYFILLLLGLFYSTKAQITSAALDVASTTKAFYPPRMTTVQKNAIVSPQAGAVVFDTDLQTLCSYNGTAWTCYTPQKAIPNGARGDFRLGKMLNSNTASGYENVQDCKADASGNFYLLGRYGGGNLAIYNFDGTSPLTLLNAGSDDVFLTKYDVNGTLLWGVRLAGTGSDQGISMTVDATGVTIAGTFQSTPMTIYNGRATTGAAETSWGTLAATTSSISDGFVVRYNTTGTVQLVARASGPSIDDASISSDGSNVYVGYTKSSATNVNIYNGRSSSAAAETSWGTQSFTNAISSFIVKYVIATGAVAWVAKADGSNLYLDDLKIAGGSLFVDYDANNATFFGAIATSGGVPANWGTITSLGNEDTFLLKMDAVAGGITWVARQGGGGSEWGNILATDALGNVYVSNISKTSVATPLTIFNARATSAAAEVSWGGLTIEGDALGTAFIAKYNSSGTVVWATNFTGTSTSLSSINGLGLAVDASQNVYVAGSYTSTLLNVYNSKSTGSSTQSLFNTAPATATNAIKGFLVKFNSLGKGEWLDRPTGPQNVIQAIDVYSNTTLFGLAAALPGTVNLGSQNITLTATNGDVFFFKYTEGN
jgi:hypothetical protein